MNLHLGRTLKTLSLAAVGILGIAISDLAIAIPVTLDAVSIRAIQLNNATAKEDQAYLLVNGVANGKEFATQIPEAKPMNVGPKTPAGTVKEPISIWKGDLADGEFAYITVTLIQGTGENKAKIKEYADKKLAIEQKVKARANAKATKDTELPIDETLTAQQAFIKDIKKILSREAKTDHFGGLFNVTIWNHGGKIEKRIDPVGLTFGEHYGIDPKIYTKLKYTRKNVMLQDDKGEWASQELTPLSDDQDIIRVKMLEVETTKQTTDYLIELQIKNNGKPELWNLKGEQSGPTELHKYWDYAE